MQFINWIQALEMLCKSNNKWGIHFSMNESDEWEEIIKAAPWLCSEIYWDGIVLFDSENEMELCYDQTVGDDGPTKLNKYNGSARVYVITCGPDGVTRNENT